MRVALNWLREFIDVDLSPEELALRLTMAGLEVEGIERRGSYDVRVARIAEMVPHPGADRLWVCQVDAGDGVVPVVCAATNMVVGDSVALASEGTVLLGGQRVER